MKLKLQITLDTADLTIGPHGNRTGNFMGNLMGAVQFREGCQAKQREADILSLNLAPPSIHQTKINDKTWN